MHILCYIMLTWCQLLHGMLMSGLLMLAYLIASAWNFPGTIQLTIVSLLFHRAYYCTIDNAEYIWNFLSIATLRIPLSNSAHQKCNQGHKSKGQGRGQWVDLWGQGHEHTWPASWLQGVQLCCTTLWIFVFIWIHDFSWLTLWRPLLPFGYSYKASCAIYIRVFCRSWLSIRESGC